MGHPLLDVPLVSKDEYNIMDSERFVSVPHEDILQAVALAVDEALRPEHWY